ncbi:IS3 family transposase, partial [Tetragenococcus koreensis]
MQTLIARDHNLLNITWLCEIAQVSRSGFYAWQHRAEKRAQREAQDQADFELILEAYNYRGFQKGSRSIHMRLLHTGTRMNRKKIQRLMQKYRLFCPIRKANPYRKMAKAKKENTILPNVLNRQFKATGPKTVLLTDVTYLFYGRQQKAYLSTIKDAYTHQILAYALSPSLEEDFILETIHRLYKDHALPKNFHALIHSDQGVHYTNLQFQTLVHSQQLRQSMSRRGNCWDNAPQESFFGHMKDEIQDLAGIDSYAQVQSIIDDYMDYYNHERYQWALAKCAPHQYEQYLKTGIHPLQTLNQ